MNERISRVPKDIEEQSNIFRDWRRGMSYEDLHAKYMSPATGCECDGCEAARKAEPSYCR